MVMSLGSISRPGSESTLTPSVRSMSRGNHGIVKCGILGMVEYGVAVDLTFSHQIDDLELERVTLRTHQLAAADGATGHTVGTAASRACPQRPASQ